MNYILEYNKDFRASSPFVCFFSASICSFSSLFVLLIISLNVYLCFQYNIFTFPAHILLILYL